MKRWLVWATIVICLIMTGCNSWRSAEQPKTPQDPTTKQVRDLVSKAQQAVDSEMGWKAKLHIENSEKTEKLEVTCVKDDVQVRYLSGQASQQPEMVYVKEKAPVLFIKTDGSWSREKLGAEEVVKNFQMLCEFVNPTYVLQGFASDQKNPFQLTEQGNTWILEAKVNDHDRDTFLGYLGENSRSKLETTGREETILYRVFLAKGSHQVQKIERREETKSSSGQTSVFLYNTDDIVVAKKVHLTAEALQAPLAGNK